MTEEERNNLLHPEKECEYCHRKFRAKRRNDRWCCPECRKKDNARAQREKRAKEKEEAEAFKNGIRRQSNASVSFEVMLRLQKKYNMSYGKIEDAIRVGRIKVEEC